MRSVTALFMSQQRRCGDPKIAAEAKAKLICWSAICDGDLLLVREYPLTDKL